MRGNRTAIPLLWRDSPGCPRSRARRPVAAPRCAPDRTSRRRPADQRVDLADLGVGQSRIGLGERHEARAVPRPRATPSAYPRSPRRRGPPRRRRPGRAPTPRTCSRCRATRAGRGRAARTRARSRPTAGRSSTSAMPPLASRVRPTPYARARCLSMKPSTPRCGDSPRSAASAAQSAASTSGETREVGRCRASAASSRARRSRLVRARRSLPPSSSRSYARKRTGRSASTFARRAPCVRCAAAGSAKRRGCRAGVPGQHLAVEHGAVGQLLARRRRLREALGDEFLAARPEPDAPRGATSCATDAVVLPFDEPVVARARARTDPELGRVREIKRYGVPPPGVAAACAGATSALEAAVAAARGDVGVADQPLRDELRVEPRDAARARASPAGWRDADAKPAADELDQQEAPGRIELVGVGAQPRQLLRPARGPAAAARAPRSSPRGRGRCRPAGGGSRCAIVSARSPTAW